jgi:hypothetical protein
MSQLVPESPWAVRIREWRDCRERPENMTMENRVLSTGANVFKGLVWGSSLVDFEPYLQIPLINRAPFFRWTEQTGSLSIDYGLFDVLWYVSSKYKDCWLENQILCT